MDEEGFGRDEESHSTEGAEHPVSPPPSSVPNSPAEIESNITNVEPDVVEAEYRELLDDPKVQLLIARFLSRSEETTGSVPPPSFLRAYEEIRPGAADLVFARYELEGQMAAKEQAHRHAGASPRNGYQAVGP